MRYTVKVMRDAGESGEGLGLAWFILSMLIGIGVMTGIVLSATSVLLKGV